MDLRCWWKFVANSFSKFRILSWVISRILGFSGKNVGYPQCDEPVVVASPLHRNVCCLPCWPVQCDGCVATNSWDPKPLPFFRDKWRLVLGYSIQPARSSWAKFGYINAGSWSHRNGRLMSLLHIVSSTLAEHPARLLLLSLLPGSAVHLQWPVRGCSTNLPHGDEKFLLWSSTLQLQQD